MYIYRTEFALRTLLALSIWLILPNWFAAHNMNDFVHPYDRVQAAMKSFATLYRSMSTIYEGTHFYILY